METKTQLSQSGLTTQIDPMVEYWKTIVVLAAIVFTLSCSSRQVYQPTTAAIQLSPNAININTASVDELERLPHIGLRTAEAIVQFRKENGPFRRPEYLLQIRGISEKRFLEIRPYLKTE